MGVRWAHSEPVGPFQPQLVVSSQGTRSRRIISMPFFNGLCSVLGLQEKWYTLHQQGGRRHEMSSMWSRTTIQRAVAVTCGLLIGLPATFAQTPGDQTMGTPDTQQTAPLLSPDQLNNLVAPIALYPDPLLSQVLSASTYPLEIVQAQQWLGQSRNLQGTQLVEAAKQQNWDPSIQALVVFPNALALLANDIRWTTDLGNAFLAQQADVMSAIQRMRARARSNGKLTNTPQQVVTTATQEGRDAIEIQPADPQVIYVPTYSPTYVWGRPVWGEYPDLWYPAGYGYGFGFGPGYYMSSYYPNWGGWGGWGWGCGWFGGGLYLNAGFFNSYGYRHGGFGNYGGYGGGSGFGGRAAWMHDPGHRMGVPYPNGTVSSRFSRGGMNGNSLAGGARTGGGQWNGGRSDSGRQSPSQLNRADRSAGTSGVRSPASGGWQRFGDSNRSQAAGPSDARGLARTGDAGSSRQPSSNYSGNGGSRSYQSPAQNDRRNGGAQSYRSSPSSGQSFSPGYSAPRGGGASAPRSYSAPSRNYSAPQSYSGQRSFGGGGSSAPRSYSAPSRNYSAPQSYSGQRSFGGSGSSAPRSYSAPRQSYSAPRTSSGPRVSGGGSGYSGGNSGSSGSRSAGGGGHRR